MERLMFNNIHFMTFSTEIGLVALALGCLIADLFMPSEEKRGNVLAVVAMAGLSLLLVNLFFQWGQFGAAFKQTFVQDGVSYFFKTFFLLAGIFVLFMAREYQAKLERGRGEFILLILFSIVGAVFLVSANDFLVFFVALETLTISSYIMTAYLRNKSASIEAGAKYLVLGALSTGLFLYGLSFVYGSTGSTSYAQIQEKLLILGSVPKAFIFGSLLIVSSLAFKIAAVPFQLWAPDVYEGAPTPVTAHLAIISKAAGFAALIRLVLTVFAPIHGILTTLFAALAAVTIIYGNLGAIPQTNIKRLLGYSSIGHAGYLLIGLAAFQQTGNEAILFYLLSYLFTTAGAFLVLVAISSHVKSDEISELAGLSKKSPLLAAGMMLSLFSLAGVPPLSGFFAKFYILWSGVKSGLLWLVVIGAINVVTSLYYYLKVVKAMYIDKPLTETAPYKLSPAQKFFQYASILGMLTLGIFPGPFVAFIKLLF